MVSRSIYDIFVSSENAVAHASGEIVEKATEVNRFRLMTVTAEERNTQEDNYSTISEASYVVACPSVEFATNTLLNSSSYGNSDLLLSVLRYIGREPVPVGLKYKNFANYEIQTIEQNDATAYTVFFTVAPLVVALFAGVFVIVRRKNR
jgi:hypothetical protein